MASKKIMVLTEIEDIIENGEVIGKLVTDGAGNQVKVKVGRGGHLKNKWDELLIGRAYSFTMGEFKGFPFVEDFSEVKDIMVKEAQRQVESGPAPQEIGMWWKEAGELYRMWKMHPETMPDKDWAKGLVRAYLVKMFEILPIKILDKEL